MGGPWLDDAEQSTWRAFLWSTQLFHEALDRQLQRDSGIPHTYYMILAMLSESSQRTRTMTELAAATRFSPSRLSHAVSRLEKNGWIKRKRHPHHGRSIVAELTDEGFAALREAAVGHVAEVRKLLFDPLTSDEQEQLRGLCEKILVTLPNTRGCAADSEGGEGSAAGR